MDYLLTNDPTVLGGEITTDSTYFDPEIADHAVSLREIEHYFPLFGLNECWIQFHAYLKSPEGNRQGQGHLIAFYHNGGDDRWLYLRRDGEAFYETEPPYGDTGSASSTERVVDFTANELNVVDVHLIKSGYQGDDNKAKLTFYRNGLPIFEYVGPVITDPNDTSDIWDRFSICSGSFLYYNDRPDGESLFVSNLRISDEPTIDTRFKIVPFSGAGNYDQFRGGIEELSDLDPVSKAESTEPGQRVSGTLDVGTLPDMTITGVSVVSDITVDAPSSDPNTLAHFVRIDGTDYDQSPVTPRGLFHSLTTELSVNPATGEPWTAADFDAIEFGLVSSTV